jgi:His-Xaa-Ser system protein HxsD
MAEENNSILDNIEIHKDFAIISINPKLYPLSVIYSAAYWLLDRVHVIIDGDTETEILVEIRPKNKSKQVDLKEIGYEFNDELINYSVYTVQSMRNKNLREMIMQNALAGNLRNQPQLQKNPAQQAERCDCMPQQPTNNSSPKQPGQLFPKWNPGQQSLAPDEIEKINRLTEETKNSRLFKADSSTDREGISKIRDYRHKTEEF